MEVDAECAGLNLKIVRFLRGIDGDEELANNLVQLSNVILVGFREVKEHGDVGIDPVLAFGLEHCTFHQRARSLETLHFEGGIFGDLLLQATDKVINLSYVLLPLAGSKVEDVRYK